MKLRELLVAHRNYACRHMNDTEEDDPLNVRQLGVTFDYLMFQISEKIAEISQETENDVVLLQKTSELKVNEMDKIIASLKKLIADCTELENDFERIKQLGFIVAEFKTRIDNIKSSI